MNISEQLWDYGLSCLVLLGDNIKSIFVGLKCLDGEWGHPVMFSDLSRLLFLCY